MISEFQMNMKKKLNKALGFQKSHSTKQRVNKIISSKTKNNDENVGHDLSMIIARTRSNPSLELTTNNIIIDAASTSSDDSIYNSWVGSEVLFQPAKKYLPAIQEMITELEEETRKIHGASVEDNRFCVSVHFRQVREEDYNILQEKVKSVVKNYPEFHWSEGDREERTRISNNCIFNSKRN
ncbi:hypothetical protein QYF36_025529 [Acer negundo]|nr:hypothetical protein QYF36_025529 [Acer negundo]